MSFAKVMNKLYVIVGLPGSGKTQLAERMFDDAAGNINIIDDISIEDPLFEFLPVYKLGD